MRTTRSAASVAALLGPYLVVAAIVAAVVAGLVVRPDHPDGSLAAPQVILVGAGGLRWDDVNPDDTPHLWALAQGGAIGSLSVRSAHSPTCVADGWLTLGAGTWAGDRHADRVHGQAREPGESCPRLDVTIEQDGGVGAHLPHQETLVRHNQWELPWRAVPGALAGAVECTAAFGPGAAVAAARSYGRVDRYHPVLPANPDTAVAVLTPCELAIVDMGTVAGEGPFRAATARRADQILGRVLAARSPEALVLVAGVSDTSDHPHLHVAVADGPDLAPGWLGSATTDRTGYLQLVDLAPTVLTAVGRPPPEVPLSGSPVTTHPGRPTDLSLAVAQLVAVDQKAVQTAPVTRWFLIVLTVVQLALLVALVPLLLRRDSSRPGRGVAQVLLVAAALAIPAALVAGMVPWWRAQAVGAWFTVVWAAVLAVAVAAVVGSPVFRRTLALVGTVAAIAGVAVAADLLTGSRLQLNGVVGYSAHGGDRFAGLGSIGLGVLIAGTLLVAGCLAGRVNRRRRPLVVAAVGAVGVVLAGSPYLGADVGGAVALLAGVCVAAALCSGGWVRPHRLAWPMLVGLLVVVLVAIADLTQPAELRTGLGSLFTEIAEGTAGFGVQRVSLANATALTNTPLSVLAAGAGAFLWLVLLRPWAGLRRLFGVHPALRAAVIGAATASLLGGILVGAALTVAGAAAAVGVPLLAVAALRVQTGPTRQPTGGQVAAVPVRVEFRGPEDRAE